MKYLVIAIFLIITNCKLSAQFPIPLEETVIKVQFDKSLVQFPFSGIAYATTSEKHMSVKVDAELELTDLDNKLLDILKSKFGPAERCENSVTFYSAQITTENKRLILNLDLRPKLENCDLIRISTNHRGDLRLWLEPYVKDGEIGIIAHLIDHSLGEFIRVISSDFPFVLVKEKIPSSYSRHNIELLSFSASEKAGVLYADVSVSGIFTSEEFGILLNNYMKSGKKP